MLCDYCNINTANFIFKNGKSCCESNYYKCPEFKKKFSEKMKTFLKKQYADGKRSSHFKIYNNGSVWKNRKHSQETKDKISKKSRERKTSDETRNKHSVEMKERYARGWTATAGRCKKIKYISNIAGSVNLDGSWELATAKFFDKEKINWKRNTIRFKYFDKNKKERTYCPDFYLSDLNIYIEVKGHITDLDKIKWKQFTEKLEVWDYYILIKKGILESNRREVDVLPAKQEDH